MNTINSVNESKAVGYVCQEGSVTFYMDGSFNLQPPAGTELVPEPALHAAEELLKQREAELGELRRRVGELEADMRRGGYRYYADELKLLASDGGADAA